MFQKKRSVLAIGAALAMTASTGAWATNGMNFEGYGARAAAMGGASSAYDSGNAAVMNNPATLGLMEDGTGRLGLGLLFLGPDITASAQTPMGTVSEDSDGTAYWAPAGSYMIRRGSYSYGIAIMAQGGMGTEYGYGSDLFSMGLPWSCSRSSNSKSAASWPLNSGISTRISPGLAGSASSVSGAAANIRSAPRPRNSVGVHQLQPPQSSR